MVLDVDDPPTSLGIRIMRRRALIGAGGLAGLALATGLPALVLAQEDNQGDDQDNRKNRKGGHAFTVTGTAHGGAAFRGRLKFTNFAVQQSPTGNHVISNGLLSGRFVDSSGREIARLDQAAFTAPVNNVDPPPANACQILNLTLGPLTLNLLGLVVEIPSPIVINIFAIPGAGNLLGNLLCAVANLLNGNPLSSLLGNLAALQQLVSLLNQIIGILNGL